MCIPDVHTRTMSSTHSVFLSNLWSNVTPHQMTASQGAVWTCGRCLGNLVWVAVEIVKQGHAWPMKIVPLRQICRTMEVLMLGGGFQGVVIRSRQNIFGFYVQQLPQPRSGNSLNSDRWLFEFWCRRVWATWWAFLMATVAPFVLTIWPKRCPRWSCKAGSFQRKPEMDSRLHFLILSQEFRSFPWLFLFLFGDLLIFMAKRFK